MTYLFDVWGKVYDFWGGGGSEGAKGKGKGEGKGKCLNN